MDKNQNIFEQDFVIYPSYCLKFGKIPRKKEEINRSLQLNTSILTTMGHIQFITPVCANGKVNESWHLLSQIKVHSHTHTHEHTHTSRRSSQRGTLFDTLIMCNTQQVNNRINPAPTVPTLQVKLINRNLNLFLLSGTLQKHHTPIHVPPCQCIFAHKKQQRAQTCFSTWKIHHL